MNHQPITGLQLTADQQTAADKFYGFLHGPSTRFVLSGGAGCGKTTLMSYICMRVLKDYQDSCAMLSIPVLYNQLGFTATTNKAAEVLEQSLNLPVQTIHSYLGLRVSEDYKTGKTNLFKTQGWCVRKGIILFIDEASMVDANLYDLILESFQESKIVFVGDHSQMTPVGERFSPVFDNVEEENYVFLDKPIRNAGAPALVALCAQLRETVETGIFRPMQEVPGVIDYLDDGSMPQALHARFTNLNPSSRVLCYTNTRVDAFNEFIREEVRLQTPEFVVGDRLIVAQNYTVGKNTLNVEREVVLEHLGKTWEDTDFIDAFPDAEPIRYQEATVAGLAVKIPLNKAYWITLVKAFAKAKRWSEHFTLKGRYIDLRDKAACTVYKSQGSTYTDVFVDLGNIGTSFDKEQVARMLFVAVSRATTRVVFYGQLPPAYRGK